MLLLVVQDCEPHRPHSWVLLIPALAAVLPVDDGDDEEGIISTALAQAGRQPVRLALFSRDLQRGKQVGGWRRHDNRQGTKTISRHNLAGGQKS